jgi:hypothetical protein
MKYSKAGLLVDTKTILNLFLSKLWCMMIQVSMNSEHCSTANIIFYRFHNHHDLHPCPEQGRPGYEKPDRLVMTRFLPSV